MHEAQSRYVKISRLFFYPRMIFRLRQMKKFDEHVTKMIHNRKINVSIKIHNLERIRFER